MSTQTPQPETRSTANQFEQYVERQLESTRQQVKLTEVTAGLLSLGLWVLGFLLVGVLVDSWLVQFGPTTRLLVFLLLAAGSAWIAWTQVIVLFVRRIHRLYAARMIEEGSENFHNSLVNYLQVKEGGQVDREAVVQAISQRAARDLSKISATEKVDRSLPIKLGFGLVALVGLLVGYTLLSPKSPWPSIARILNPVSSIAAPSIAEVVNVTPGSTDVFFGQKLLVTAEIRGRHNPDDVRLVYSTTDGQQVDVPRAMQPAGKGNAYQLELSTTPTGIDGPLFYYVIANDGRSPTYSVNVKPNPAITLQKFEVIPPSYTRLPARTVEGQTEIEGLEGSQVKLTATANMPIQVAWLELLRQKTRGRETTYEPVRTIELRNQPPSSDESGAAQKLGAAQKFSAEGEFFLALDANRTGQLYTHYQLQFRTVDGERNPLVNVQPLKVKPDLPPVVNVVRPFDREVAVPLNRALEIELQAEDQDFEISRLQLLLDHQGGRLLDEEVELGDNRKQQRISANYRFEPRKLQLSVGDEVIFHARASDNRVAALSGQSDPNVTRTENYSIKITEPLETDIAQDQPEEQTGESGAGNQTADNSSKSEAQTSNSSGQAEPESAANSEQANNQPAGAQESEANQAPGGDAQSAMSEANPGKSSGDQPNQNNPGEKSPEQQSQPSGDEEKQSDQPAEIAEQPDRPADNKSSGDSSGEQKSSQASGSSGESSKQPAQGEGENPDQQEKENQGAPSGETQANSEAKEKQMGQGGQPNPSSEPKQSAEQGAQNQSQGSQPGKQESTQPQAGEQPGDTQQPEQNQASQQAGSGKQGDSKSQQGEQAAGSPAGGNEASSENSGQENSGQEKSGQGAKSTPSQGNKQSPNSGKQEAGQPDAGQPDAGQPDAGQPDANQTGERGEESAGQPSDAQGSQSDGDPSAGNEEPLDKSATDAERFQRLQERSQRQRQSSQKQSAQDAQSGAQENQKSAAENQPGQNQPSNQDASQPQSQNLNDGQPESGKPTQQQGDQPEGDQPEGEPQPGKQGEPKSAGNSANQPGKPDSPNAPSQTPQPSTEKSGDQADQSGSQQRGSGEPGKQQSGSSDKGQADKQGSSAEKSSQQSGQAGSSQQSGDASQQSSDPSDPASKQSGDGQQGGSKQSGSGSQGNSQSNQSGQTSSKTGQPGGESTGESGSSGNTSGADNATASQSELSKRNDQPNDQQSSSGETNPQGTGKAGSNAAPAQDYSDAPEQAEGNLDYSRKATDLVLDELRNQANKPDPELLKEMNWTEQDLKDFISRWEAMKKKAGSGVPQERKRYEDALRSLGLRPEPVRRNIIKSRRDELNKLSEDGAVNRPPANLADEFNAFLKNRNRVQKNK